MIRRNPLYQNVSGFLLLLLVLSSGLTAVDKVALTMKTTGDVQHKGDQVPDLQALRRGTALFDGDLIVTGEDGLAIALFLDDKSQLKIRRNTETQIAGTRREGVISKQVDLAYGTLKATIGKQTKDFTITTPTSVASIKGTELWVIAVPDSGDIIISIEGGFDLTNLISGRIHSVVPGTVLESNVRGEINVLITVRIKGEASSGVSAGRFTLSGISILEGDVGLESLSGTVEVTGNTVFEGADVDVGVMVTLTGVLDEQTGNIVATLVEIAEPITVEGIAASSPVGGTFMISDVTLISGEARTLPTEVRITEETAIEGDDIVAGAEVTVVGNYNEETERIEATQIVVVIPQLKLTGRIAAIPSEGVVELSDIVVVAGDVEASQLSGTIIITESTVIEGEPTVGAKVTVTGTVNDATGDVAADQMDVAKIVLVAVINSPMANDEFEITDISVLEGDIDPSVLSGKVRIETDVEIEGGEIIPGLQVTVTGTVEEDTGIFLARRVVVIVEMQQLIFEMEDNHGRRKELIIQYQ